MTTINSTGITGQPQTSVRRGSVADSLMRTIGETSLNRRTNVGLAAALIAGLLVVWLRWDGYISGFIWAGACVGIGGLLGFLFGIPRTQAPVVVERANVAAIGNKVEVEHPPSEVPASSAGKVPRQPDTATVSGQESNLEQISDWVTKLLVGGGLTQLQDIPGRFWEWGGNLAPGLTPAAPDPAAQVFATGLIIYFLILGFFGGYLITILQLRPGLKAANDDK